MKRLSILLLSLISVFTALAQSEGEEKTKSSFKEKLVLDGNIALQFGNLTVLGANPQVGYRITDGFIAGLGYSYYYYSFKAQDGSKFIDQSYGPTAFARAVVMENFFVRTDYQQLKYVQSSGSDARAYDYNLNKLFMGGGYRQSLNSNVSAYFGVFVDVLSPDPTPVFRGGIEAGFGGR